MAAIKPGDEGDRRCSVASPPPTSSAFASSIDTPDGPGTAAGFATQANALLRKNRCFQVPSSLFLSWRVSPISQVLVRFLTVSCLLAISCFDAEEEHEDERVHHGVPGVPVRDPRRAPGGAQPRAQQAQVPVRLRLRGRRAGRDRPEDGGRRRALDAGPGGELPDSEPDAMAGLGPGPPPRVPGRQDRLPAVRRFA